MIYLDVSEHSIGAFPLISLSSISRKDPFDIYFIIKYNADIIIFYKTALYLAFEKENIEIVKLLDFESEPHPILVMKYISKGSLREMLSYKILIFLKLIKSISRYINRLNLTIFMELAKKNAH